MRPPPVQWWRAANGSNLKPSAKIATPSYFSFIGYASLNFGLSPYWFCSLMPFSAIKKKNTITPIKEITMIGSDQAANPNNTDPIAAM
jgi:hypothetical protein